MRNCNERVAQLKCSGGGGSGNGRCLLAEKAVTKCSEKRILMATF